MKFQALQILVIALIITSVPTLHAQGQLPYERLPQDILDIKSPTARVIGGPGNMQIQDRSCRNLPIESVRRRIVNSVTQEWAFFGYGVDDMTRLEVPTGINNLRRRVRRRTNMSEQEAARVADSIGGYWAAAPDSSWILQRQNESWNARGITSRWRNPWSAAFISWVMCESGLGNPEQFQRAIAHHSYIDQAILSRDGLNSSSAFTAYDPGEALIIPGDMLCRGSRPAYSTIDQRRKQLGQGARTHCDIVVKVDEAESKIHVIGGNVRGSVRMKLLPAALTDNGILFPTPFGGRRIFSHLKLTADSIEANALDYSPTFGGIACTEIETTDSGLLTSQSIDQLTIC